MVGDQMLGYLDFEEDERVLFSSVLRLKSSSILFLPKYLWRFKNWRASLLL